MCIRDRYVLLLANAVQAQKNKKKWRFLMGQHRSWRAFFTCFWYVPFFGSMWKGIIIFGTFPKMYADWTQWRRHGGTTPPASLPAVYDFICAVLDLEIDLKSLEYIRIRVYFEVLIKVYLVNYFYLRYFKNVTTSMIVNIRDLTWRQHSMVLGRNLVLTNIAGQ